MGLLFHSQNVDFLQIKTMVKVSCLGNEVLSVLSRITAIDDVYLHGKLRSCSQVEVDSVFLARLWNVSLDEYIWYFQSKVAKSSATVFTQWFCYPKKLSQECRTRSLSGWGTVKSSISWQPKPDASIASFRDDHLSSP